MGSLPRTTASRKPTLGFTLVELLIVVAIIAILAAIAVPNFQEAVVRSKVSRTKADQRSIATGLEAYRTDNNSYPVAPTLSTNFAWRLAHLTTPISYVSSIFTDPFYKYSDSTYGGTEPYYCLASGNLYNGNANPLYNTREYHGSIYSIAGRGPDTNIIFGGYCMAHPVSLSTQADIRGAYDPTNGTVSAGDIFRVSSSTMGRAY